MGLGAVLFDVDGVLLDSAAAHRRVWDAWAGMRGLDPAVVWPLTFGRRPQDTVALVAPELDSGRELVVLDELLGREEGAIGPVTGAGELLRALPEGAWAVVTSGGRASVRTRFAAARLPLPRVLVCAEDVARGKPAPEGYLKAAAELGVEPGMCLVVEDAPAGVAAGRAAGCLVAGFGSTYGPEELRSAEVFFRNHADTVAFLRAAGMVGGHRDG